MTPSPGHADRHSAGVNLHSHESDPGQGSAEHRSGCYDPSDPRPSILPCGGAGWAVRGDQECEATPGPCIRHRSK
jgi:hypothetical protein